MVLTRRLLALSAAGLTAALLVACDSHGGAYEDLRLARLTEGESTEQEVRRLFGDPVAVRDLAGGKGFGLSTGP